MKKEMFRRPWRVEEIHDAFVVKDADGMVLIKTEFSQEGRVGMAKWQARIIADRMIEAADVLSFQNAPEA